MFLGIYRFEGHPEQLQNAYDTMIGMIPANNLHLHVCVPDAHGLWIYDSCPTREVFQSFAESNDFRTLLRTVGLPEPRVMPIGDIHTAYVMGKRVF